jgi:small-conductance mechanosensitive channel
MDGAWLTVRDWLSAVWTAQQTLTILHALALLAAGFALSRLARLAVQRGLSRQLSRQQLMLAHRTVYYAILLLFVASALRQIGFDLTVLLGAAGILTVAIGFASQTSASNLISGLFLVFEGAVEVGDVIRVGDITGEVLSVDLLSTKLRTFDNLLVRVPNETMVKANITNMNRFPIRRVDLQIGVAYKEDLAQVAAILKAVADKHPLCLEEPAPLIIAQGFGESSVNYQLSVWAKTENFLALRNAMQNDIKNAFDREGIEIPFPHRTLFLAEGTAPLAGAAPAPPDAGEEKA